MKIGISPNDTKAIIDTYNGIYNIRFVAKFDCMSLDGVGLELEWTDTLGMKKVWFNIDTEIKTNISGVPVSFSNFWFGADEIDNTKPFILWTLTGQTDIEVADVTEVIPSLEKYMQETPVMSFEETGIELALGNNYIKLSTKAKLLGEINLGSLELTAGKISYTNAMLGMYNESASGILADLKVDVSFNLANVSSSVKGEAQISMTNRFFGLYASGDIDMTVKLWILKPNLDIQGDALVGLYTENDGDMIFTIRAYKDSFFGGRNFQLNISKNGPTVVYEHT